MKKRIAALLLAAVLLLSLSLPAAAEGGGEETVLVCTSLQMNGNGEFFVPDDPRLETSLSFSPGSGRPAAFFLKTGDTLTPTQITSGNSEVVMLISGDDLAGHSNWYHVRAQNFGQTVLTAPGGCSMQVTVALPSVGFYSAPQAGEEDYISDYQMSGQGDQVFYLAGLEGVTLRDLIISPDDYEGDEETYQQLLDWLSLAQVPGKNAFSVTVSSDFPPNARLRVEFRVTLEENGGSFTRRAGIHIMGVNAGHGGGHRDPTVDSDALFFRQFWFDDRNEPQFWGGDQTELTIELSSMRQVLFYYGTSSENEQLAVTSLTVSPEGALEAEKVVRQGLTFWELRPRGTCGKGVMTLTVSGGETYMLPFEVALPYAGFYTGPERTPETWCRELSSSQLESLEYVYYMMEDGISESERSRLVPCYFVNSDPYGGGTPQEMTEEEDYWFLPRQGGGYDLKLRIPQVQMTSQNDRVTLCVGRTGESHYDMLELVNRYEGNAVYVESGGVTYAVGFGFQEADGDVIIINEGNWVTGNSTSSDASPSNGRYPFRDFTVYAGVARQDAYNNVYYEVDRSGAVGLNVTEMRVELLLGCDQDTYSWEEASSPAVLTKTSGFENGTSAMLYVKHGFTGFARIWATVEITTDSETVTKDVSFLTEIRRSSTRDYHAEDINSVADLNAYLKAIADNDVDTAHPDEEQRFQVYLGDAALEGTVVIPSVFNHEKALVLFGWTGNSGATRLKGNIDLNGANVGLISNIHFSASQAGQGTAVGGGAVTNVDNCSFRDYAVALNSTEKGMVNSRENVFLNNTVAAQIDVEDLHQDMSRNTWERNTFIGNGTAVLIRSLNEFISPYYFRIIESNFIGNETDMETRCPGTIYLYRNYYAEIPGTAGYSPVSPAGYLQSLMNGQAGSESYCSPRLVTVPQINEIIANPRQAKLVPCVWSIGVPPSAVLSGLPLPALQEEDPAGPGTGSGPKLTADWDSTTRILNGEARDLRLDASAFDQEGEKLIELADARGEVSARWDFGEEAIPGLTGDFFAGISLAGEGEGMTITVTESSVLTGAVPTLILPYEPGDGNVPVVSFGGSEIASSWADGMLSFPAAAGGVYTVTETAAVKVTSVSADRSRGRVTAEVLRDYYDGGETVDLFLTVYDENGKMLGTALSRFAPGETRKEMVLLLDVSGEKLSAGKAKLLAVKADGSLIPAVTPLTFDLS